MKDSVDKQKFYSEGFNAFEIDENFSSVARKGEGEDIGRLIFAPINDVEFF